MKLANHLKTVSELNELKSYLNQQIECPDNLLNIFYKCSKNLE